MKFKTVSLMLAFIFVAGSAVSPVNTVYAAEVSESADQSETQNGEIVDKESGFEYNILSDGTIELRAYKGSAEELVIPETIDGKKVTSISFFGQLLESHLSVSVKSVVIPDSVTRLGASAFEDCQFVEKITIPDSVKEIGLRAFTGCSSLKSIALPEGVTEIGEEFFADCKNLASVTLPESVTSIGVRAFAGCSSLETLALPKNTASIGAHAWKDCQSLKGIQIPEGVAAIPEGAFSGSRSLAYAAVPKSVTSIGNGAFSECTSLKDIYYAAGNADWEKIQTGSDNEVLKTASIHYDTAEVPQPDETFRLS